MVLDRVLSILETCPQEHPLVPPTDLYNEGWMLRIVLDWFSGHEVPNHPLYFSENCNWFSEALLPTPFPPRSRGDKFGESWTHADGVIGHFDIGKENRGGLTLKRDATHFVVLEAKMFSKLSSGTTHASYYNQAARYVGCITETLKKAGLEPDKMQNLGFYVLAPESQIERGIFNKFMQRDHIEKTIKRRADEYDTKQNIWLAKKFQSTIDNIHLVILSWEQIIAAIRNYDPAFHNHVQEFYKHCLQFNSTGKNEFSFKNR